MAGSDDSPRVLSIQSHVVHGYVGNRAAVFPLQLLGFEVDVINTVQLSNHLGYPSSAGQKLEGHDLDEIVKGLADNGKLTPAHLLTGFIGTSSFLQGLLRLLKQLPKPYTYVCDPVFGDNGRLYISPEIVGMFREHVLPFATILTPNHFELEQLTQQTVGTLSDALSACKALHQMGPPVVVVTTLEVKEAGDRGEDTVAMLLSEAASGHQWLLRLPYISGGPFTGTGDLTSAMLLAWSARHTGDAPLALEKAGAVLQSVIRETVDGACATTIGSRRVPPELRIIAAKRFIEDPQVSVRCQLVSPSFRPPAGVLLHIARRECWAWCEPGAAANQCAMLLAKSVRVAWSTGPFTEEAAAKMRPAPHEIREGTLLPLEGGAGSTTPAESIAFVQTAWGVSAGGAGPSSLVVASDDEGFLLQARADGCVAVRLAANEIAADHTTARTPTNPMVGELEPTVPRARSAWDQPDFLTAASMKALSRLLSRLAGG